ncbi:hypothetical protein DL98DRAFT_82034 [Cadophora sp. DSE1049]|nr:hypothetical protein DL98DRAFT_82034 [Cadophora sp. DSE1049]
MPSETLRTPLLTKSMDSNLILTAESWRVRRTTGGDENPFWVPSEHLQPYAREKLSSYRADAPHSSPSTSVWHETNPLGTGSRSHRRDRRESRPQVQDTLDAVRELGLNTSDVVFGDGLLKIELRKMDDGTEYDSTTLPTTVKGWPVNYTRLSDRKEPERKNPKLGDDPLPTFPRLHFATTLDAIRDLRLHTKDFVFSNGSLKIELEKMDDGAEYDLTTLPTTINGWPVTYTSLSDKKEPESGDGEGE